MKIFFQNMLNEVLKVVKNGLCQKNSKQGGGGQGHGISSGIEERACENSRGQLKKKQNFRRCLRKNCGISIGLGF